MAQPAAARSRPASLPTTVRGTSATARRQTEPGRAWERITSRAQVRSSTLPQAHRVTGVAAPFGGVVALAGGGGGTCGLNDAAPAEVGGEDQPERLRRRRQGVAQSMRHPPATRASHAYRSRPPGPRGSRRPASTWAPQSRRPIPPSRCSKCRARFHGRRCSQSTPKRPKRPSAVALGADHGWATVEAQAQRPGGAKPGDGQTAGAGSEIEGSSSTAAAARRRRSVRLAAPAAQQEGAATPGAGL